MHFRRSAVAAVVLLSCCAVTLFATWHLSSAGGETELKAGLGAYTVSVPNSDPYSKGFDESAFLNNEIGQIKNGRMIKGKHVDHGDYLKGIGRMVADNGKHPWEPSFQTRHSRYEPAAPSDLEKGSGDIEDKKAVVKAVVGSIEHLKSTIERLKRLTQRRKVKIDMHMHTTHGPPGPRGHRGLRGQRGPRGDRGPRGNQGGAGPLGNPGPQGHRGSRGPRGARGRTGVTGNKGQRGLHGPRGFHGFRGPRGDTGKPGHRGRRGARGRSGQSFRYRTRHSHSYHNRHRHTRRTITRNTYRNHHRTRHVHSHRHIRRRHVARPRHRGLTMQYWHYRHQIRNLRSLFRGRPQRTLHQHRSHINLNGHGFRTPHRHQFAARIHARIWAPRSGHYTFYLGSDDGSNLFVNGRRVVANGGLHGFRWRHGRKYLRQGVHRIRVDFFENHGAATLRLQWRGPRMGRRYTPVFTSTGRSHARRHVRRPRHRGLTMQYWHYRHQIRNLRSLMRGRPQRTLHQHRSHINLNGRGFRTPHRHQFAARIHARIWVPRSGRYTFYLGSDDGSNLFVNRRRVVANGGLHGFRWRAGSQYLRQGVHRIRVDFFENHGAATLRLQWRGPRMGRRYTPVFTSTGRSHARRRRRHVRKPRHTGVTVQYWHYRHQIRNLRSLMRGRPQRTLHQTRSILNMNGRGFHTPARHQFATRTHARIWVPRNGVYTFYLGSDDGSNLYVNHRRVVANGGLHGFRWRHGRKYLRRGVHRIRVDFFENHGAATLRLQWRGPRMGRRYVRMYTPTGRSHRRRRRTHRRRHYTRRGHFRRLFVGRECSGRERFIGKMSLSSCFRRCRSTRGCHAIDYGRRGSNMRCYLQFNTCRRTHRNPNYTSYRLVGIRRRRRRRMHRRRHVHRRISHYTRGRFQRLYVGKECTGREKFIGRMSLHSCFGRCRRTRGCKAVDYGRNGAARRCYLQFNSCRRQHTSPNYTSYKLIGFRVRRRYVRRRRSHYTRGRFRRLFVGRECTGREKFVGRMSLGACGNRCRRTRGCHAIDYGRRGNARKCYLQFNRCRRTHRNPNYTAYRLVGYRLRRRYRHRRFRVRHRRVRHYHRGSFSKVAVGRECTGSERYIGKMAIHTCFMKCRRTRNCKAVDYGRLGSARRCYLQFNNCRRTHRSPNYTSWRLTGWRRRTSVRRRHHRHHGWRWRTRRWRWRRRWWYRRQRTWNRTLYCRSRIRRIYRRVLRRRADAGGLRHWTHRCKTGTKLRVIRAAIYNSAEYKRRFKRPATCRYRIRRYYFHILRRKPDHRGFRSWYTKCLRGMHLSVIRQKFYHSREYKRLRARWRTRRTRCSRCRWISRYRYRKSRARQLWYRIRSWSRICPRRHGRARSRCYLRLRRYRAWRSRTLAWLRRWRSRYTVWLRWYRRRRGRGRTCRSTRHYGGRALYHYTQLRSRSSRARPHGVYVGAGRHAWDRLFAVPVHSIRRGAIRFKVTARVWYTAKSSDNDPSLCLLNGLRSQNVACATLGDKGNKAAWITSAKYNSGQKRLHGWSPRQTARYPSRVTPTHARVTWIGYRGRTIVHLWVNGKHVHTSSWRYHPKYTRVSTLRVAFFRNDKAEKYLFRHIRITTSGCRGGLSRQRGRHVHVRRAARRSRQSTIRRTRWWWSRYRHARHPTLLMYTRYNSGGSSSGQSGTAIRAAFNRSPRRFGYCSRHMPSFGWFANRFRPWRGCAGKRRNVAYKFLVKFFSPGTLKWRFRLGSSFGKGGVGLLDGRVVANAAGKNARWAYRWNSAQGKMLMTPYKTLNRGYHTMEFIGFSGTQMERGFKMQYLVHGRGGWKTVNKRNLRRDSMLTHYNRRWLRRRRKASTCKGPATGQTVCCGTTSTRQWRRYSRSGMYVDINSRHCNFQGTPQYFTSMSGTSGHWYMLGQSSHYNVRSTGLRVYIRSNTAWAVRYRIRAQMSWCGIGKTKRPRVQRRSVCCGTESSRGWRVYGGRHMVRDINMAKCKFRTKPKIFTALTGTNYHYKLRGPSSIYNWSPNKFRVYIYGSSPAQARRYHYGYQWCAVGYTKRHSGTGGANYPCNGARVMRHGNVVSQKGKICCGRSTQTWTGSRAGVSVRVDTNKCHFRTTPIYFTSIAGNSNHWSTTGTNSIFQKSRSGFRVHIQSQGWRVTPARARAWHWAVEWCGVSQ